jgi:hypothetical protein
MHRSGIDPSAPDALARTPTVREEAEREAQRRQSDQNKFIGLYLTSAVAAFKARSAALS